MQRPTALFSLVLLAACDPTSTGGGTGGAGGSTSSSAASSSSSSATSAASSGGVGGAGGGASSSAASATSSSGAGTGGSGAGTGGSGAGLSVAWTKIITTAPSMYPLALKASVVSAETTDRVFVGGTLHGAYTFAGTTLYGGLSHDAAVVLALDSAGNEVSNLQFGTVAYSVFPGCLVTDAASNLFVGGSGTGVNGYETRYVQKYGASPWTKTPGNSSNMVSAGVERVEVDAAGNPMAHLYVTAPGLNFGGGLQSGFVLLKLDGASGSYVWSKPAPSGEMRRDASGDLLFLGGSPLTLTRLDTSGTTLAVKSYAGAPTSVLFTTGASGTLITGLLQGTADFGCGPLTSAGSGDNLLVIKLDAAGACVYSRRFDPAGFPTSALPMTLALTGAGDAVVIGTSTSTADFGGGPLPAGQFVLRLDPAGAFVSSWSMADPAQAAIDDSGAIYFVSSSPSFNVGTGPLLAGIKGMAIAKLVP